MLVLGGDANALSIVRSLSKRGIAVSVAAAKECAALKSRYCVAKYQAPKELDLKDFLRQLLLEAELERLRGSLLFVCNDDAIDFVATYHGQLQEHYVLDHHLPDLQLEMLDKKKTLELAKKAGCVVPRHMEVNSSDDLDDLHDVFEFPVIAKPVHSHLFKQFYDRKLFVANSLGELRSNITGALQHGLRMMVSEFIPGPDTLLSSYYTHIDEHGDHLFYFTKRMIRRCPPNIGKGCYHVTGWFPETAEMGERFFRGIGFRGLGNIEFKRDPRDGVLKVIECNARFTEAQELLTRSGMDIAFMIYQHLTRGVVPKSKGYRNDVRLWYPELDMNAFRALRQRGQLTFAQWVKSVAKKQCLPYFSLADPWPGITRGWNSVRTRAGRQIRAQSAPRGTRGML